MAVQQDLALGSEFPRPSRDRWLALVDKVLDGAAFDRVLVGDTYDDRTIQPLYTAEDSPGPDAAGLPGLAPFTRGRLAGSRVIDGWDVRQRHGGVDAAAVNAAILADLAGGATSVLVGPVGDSGTDSLARALDGVLLDVAPVCLDWRTTGLDGVRQLESVWAASGVPPSEVLGEAGIDPFGTAARLGATTQPVAIAPAVETALRIGASHPKVRPLRVDVSVYALAGAAEAQELAFALATGVAYLRALLDAGDDIDEALGRLSFTLTATPDQFATITKLRAARRCWDRVAEVSGAGGASGGPPGTRGMFLHAITSLAHYARRDPWVNPLRATLACFAAAVGGADAITVLPLGAALTPAAPRPDDELRLARNTQIVLAEESGLSRVIDPGGGAYAIEALTDELAAEAWRRFQSIERRGGIEAVLRSGWAAAEVERTWSARAADVARRRLPLTGVSEFPLAGEAAPPGGPVGEGGAGEGRAGEGGAGEGRAGEGGAGEGRAGEGGAGEGRAGEGGAFPLRRLAEPFEALRDAAPTRHLFGPGVLLANLGPQAVHAARAGFARNLFEVGGFEVVAGPGTSDPGEVAGDAGGEAADVAAEVAGEITASGAPLAVICSSDALYARYAADAARALRAAGARRVYLAGNPGDRRAAYQDAGVDEFVFVGCDAVDVLRRALHAAGVAGSTDAAGVAGQVQEVQP